MTYLYKRGKAAWCLALMATLSLSSCKDFLTENPTTQFSADFVYNTPEGLEAGVVGLYNLQRAFF